MKSLGKIFAQWVLLAALLTACSGLRIALPVDSTPTLPFGMVAPGDPTETPTPYGGICSYVWANNPMPDLSTTLRTEFRNAGMNGVEVDASAYGENCVALGTGQVISFSPQETALAFTLPVNDINDEATLGAQLTKLLTTLGNFPAQNFPGGKLGQIDVQLADPAHAANLTFQYTQAEAMMKQGLTGRALFAALQSLPYPSP